MFLITFAILTHLFFIVKQNTLNYYILYVKFFSNTICCVYCFAYTNNYSLKQTQFSERKAAIKKPFSGGIAHADRRALKIFILTPKNHAFLRLRLYILCIIIFLFGLKIFYRRIKIGKNYSLQLNNPLSTFVRLVSSSPHISSCRATVACSQNSSPADRQTVFSFFPFAA